MELNKLMSLEEKIEHGFIALARLEASNQKESYEYEDIFKTIYNCVYEEKQLLGTLDSDTIIKLRGQVMKHCRKSDFPLALGHLTNASYLRVQNIFNTMLGSEAFNYEAYLRYDLNQIIFSFLEYLINNEYYEDIRRDLIFYKYNLIFMNYLSENDFLDTKDISTISIESRSFKTDENPDLIFVDKTVLVMEGREILRNLEIVPEDFKSSHNQYVLAVIFILELLARLVLSEDDILQYLQQDFNTLLEDDNVPLEIKNLIQEMLIILEQLKNKITLAR